MLHPEQVAPVSGPARSQPDCPLHAVYRVLELRGALLRYLRQLVLDSDQAALLPVAGAGGGAAAPTLLLLRDTLYQVRAAAVTRDKLL